MLRRMVRIAAVLTLVVLIWWGASAAQAAPPVVVYQQPPRPSGGLLPSSLRDPDGSNTDQWVWDGFRFGWDQPITEVRWRGGYNPAMLGSGGPVFDFTVEIHASTPNGAMPDLAVPPLARYEVGGDAMETPAETLGGALTYDYAFVLPAPFLAAAGTKYWVQIEAYQPGLPDWGISAGLGGDGRYFRRIPLQGPTYQIVNGDAAFSLLAPELQGHRSYLPMISGGGGG